MDAARTIRDSLQAVATLRRQATLDPPLQQAVAAVKRLQSRRFAGTYPDLLRDPVYRQAAQFFLDELYGERDYAQRDEQFARIAGAIGKLFPASVADTSARLAQVHALTEDLDMAVARGWATQDPDTPPARRYALAWRAAGREEDRRRQLHAVVAMGEELALLTRTPGLRMMLRMMRAPATAAGLSTLQRFLEAGFDTFSGMARQHGAAEQFLNTVNRREDELLVLLFGGDLVACETRLELILGQAP